MSAIKQFNGLGGAVVTRPELEALRSKAIQEENEEIVFRITKLLEKFPEIETFELEEHDCHVIEAVPASLLHGLDFEPSKDDVVHGLGRVSPTEVYDLITAKVIKMIETANAKDYKKKWTDSGRKTETGYTVPFNFVTKKRYRGVNVIMLTELEALANPFFLTFKQVKDLKGKVKKGAKGYEVVYYTKIFKVEDRQKDLRFASYDKKKVESFATDNKIEKELGIIPMLKYYHVYNGSDIEGIDFKLDTFKIGFIENESPVSEVKTLPIPELIVKNYPTPKPSLKHGGDRAFYAPGKDHVQMPHLADFETVQDYYRTLLHEFSHSTGAKKRLARDFSGNFGSKQYAFEELVAELGAIFLSAEAGIIWHNNKNHAAYLKSWNSVLAQIKEDNKFIMKASTAAQKVADFVLQFDEKGDPLYFAELEKELNKPVPKDQKKTKETAKKATPKTKTVEKELYTYSLILKLKNEIITKLDLSKEGHKAKNFLNELAEKAHKNNEIRTELGDWMTGKTKTIGLIKLLENVKYSDKNLLHFNAFSMLDSTPKKTKETKKPAPKKATNTEPKGFAIKPKSVSIQAAVKDVLTLPKFKKEKEIPASIIYKHFSEAKDDEAERQGEFSKFELGVLEKSPTLLYDSDFDYITPFGVEFVKAVKGRLESLRNQKNNLALFDGLKAPVSKTKKPKTTIDTIKKGEELQYLIDKVKVASINKHGVVTWHKKGLSAATRNRIRKDAVVVGLAAPMFEEPAQEVITPGPETIPAPTPVIPIIQNAYVEKVFTDENEESITLGSPVVEPIEEKVNLPLNRNSLAYRRQNSQNATHEYYTIENPDIASFLGKIEKKKKESVAVTIAGGQGSGKTSFVFQLINEFAKHYKVGHASIEEHPESALYENKAERFWNENAKATVDSPEINSLQDIHDLIVRNDVVVIDSFSKLLSMNNRITLDETFRKKYDGKLFIIIYQLTTDGKMRGGSSSQFDGDVILFVEKFPDFADNYVFADKNRYQNLSLDDLHYNIATAKLVQPEADEPELVFTQEIERI